MVARVVDTLSEIGNSPVSDEPEDMVLQYLRRVDDGQRQIKQDLLDIKFRLSSLEATVAHFHAQLALHSRLETRLERIERRLDLAKDPPSSSR